MVTQHALETSPARPRSATRRWPRRPPLVASPQVRNQGTLGGNLCHADPTGDPPAALIALAAEVEIARQAERRRLPVEALFRDYMEPVLEPDELLVAVHLPPPPPAPGPPT